MTTEEIEDVRVADAVESGQTALGAPKPADQRLRLLATMVQGTAAGLPEAWRSYRNVDEARLAAREMMHNHRVLRVAIVEDRIPMQFIEWIGR